MITKKRNRHKKTIPDDLLDYDFGFVGIEELDKNNIFQEKKPKLQNIDEVRSYYEIGLDEDISEIPEEILRGEFQDVISKPYQINEDDIKPETYLKFNKKKYNTISNWKYNILPTIDDLKYSESKWLDFAGSQELHISLLHGLNDTFAEPLPIQKECLFPAIVQRRDIVAAAATGSGKTLAFGLPVLNGIMNYYDKRFQSLHIEEDKCVFPLKALILAPTRELAKQIAMDIKQVSKYTCVSIETIIGGISDAKQRRLLNLLPDIIVGTPGRVYSFMFGDENHDKHFYLDQIDDLKYLVIDEADRLGFEGLYREMDFTLKKIHKHNKDRNKLQKFVFSATLALMKSGTLDLKQIINSNSNNPYEKLIKYIKLREGKVSVIDLSQKTNEETHKNQIMLPTNLQLYFKHTDKDNDETDLIAFLMSNIEIMKETKILIFVNSVTYTLRLASLLNFVINRAKPKCVQEDVDNSEEDEYYYEEGNKDNNDVIDTSNLRSEILEFLKQNGKTTAVELNETIKTPKLESKTKLKKKKNKTKKIETEDKIYINSLHSKLRQKQRLKRLESFIKYPSGILVCTDIAARGLHIPNVDLVIHFQVPYTPAIFVNRSGRTARVDKKGRCLCFSTKASMRKWESLFQALELSIDKFDIPNELKTISNKGYQEIKQIFMIGKRIEVLSSLINRDLAKVNNLKSLQEATGCEEITYGRKYKLKGINQDKEDKLGKHKFYKEELENLIKKIREYKEPIERINLKAGKGNKIFTRDNSFLCIK